MGLLLPLEVGAADDNRAGFALNRRHGFEGKGTTAAQSVLACAAHAAFGMVGHGIASRRAQLTQGPSSVLKIPIRNHSGAGATGSTAKAVTLAVVMRVMTIDISLHVPLLYLQMLLCNPGLQCRIIFIEIGHVGMNLPSVFVAFDGNPQDQHCFFRHDFVLTALVAGVMIKSD